MPCAMPARNRRVELPRYHCHHRQHSHQHIVNQENEHATYWTASSRRHGRHYRRCRPQQSHTVLWASAGRTASTLARARRANLEDAGTVAELVKASEIVLSVCPPHAAEEVAREVAILAFRRVC